MKRIALALAVLVATLSVRADRLAEVIEVTPAKGWIRAKPKSGGDIPTLRFVPADGRNAEVLISLIPADESPVEDAKSLAALHEEMTTATYGSAPPKIAAIHYETKDGIGVYSTFEDPDLVGKPPKKDDYKYATSVLAWLGRHYLIVGTVFADDPKAPEHDEGIAIVKSAAIVGDASPAPSQRPADSKVAALDHRWVARAGSG